jgi:cytochrome c5
MLDFFTPEAKHFLLKNRIILIAIFLLLLLLLAYASVWQGKPDLSRFDLVKGEQLYNNICIACHIDGRFGAPKVGNPKDWAPRITKGMDALFHNAINGLNAMPPRGGNPSLSDEEVKATVAFMVSKSW